MLYVSTKNKTDSYTAYRVLHEDKTPDGGMFAPFHLPVFSAEEIAKLKQQSFSDTVANILNLFFSRRLTAWDVEFTIGRHPFKIETIGQRVIVAEVWHNNQGKYDSIVSALYNKLTDTPVSPIPQWVCIAVEISVLFGVYGQLLSSGIEQVDIAVDDSVILFPIAAWYARKMGLPIRMILCGCGEQSGLWDFFSRGEASANVAEELQQLVFECLGADEAVRFTEVRNTGRIYRISDEQTSALNQGIYTAVIGQDRIPVVAASINRTSGYHADSNTAVAYGTVQDYRAASGENQPTLLLSRQKPKE